MNREVSKFLSGAFAGIAYGHAGFAVATSTGIMSEPVFLGRKWGVGFMWTEAAVYTAISLALGYVGWSSKPRELQEPGVAATDGQSSRDGNVGQDTLLLTSR
jgi:hypothetical protein